jgi:hypothetical protein
VIVRTASLWEALPCQTKHQMMFVIPLAQSENFNDFNLFHRLSFSLIGHSFCLFAVRDAHPCLVRSHPQLAWLISSFS